MYEQLSGSLRHIQIVLKELVQCIQCLFVQIVGYIVSEDLFDEDLAQIHRQLIDQSSDSQSAIGNDFFLCIEDLAYIQCHLSFLVGLGDILQFLYHSTVCNFYIQQCFRIHHGHNSLCQFMQCLRCCGVFYGLDQDQTGFIYSSHIIARLG